MAEAFNFTLSSVVAGVFVLSAGWKLTHPREFQRAFRARMAFAARLAGVAAVVVPVIEGGVATLLILQGFTGRIGPLVAAAVLALLTQAGLKPVEQGVGCGCWRELRSADPEADRRLLLSRNAALRTRITMSSAAF